MRTCHFVIYLAQHNSTGDPTRSVVDEPAHSYAADVNIPLLCTEFFDSVIVLSLVSSTLLRFIPKIISTITVKKLEKTRITRKTYSRDFFIFSWNNPLSIWTLG